MIEKSYSPLSPLNHGIPQRSTLFYIYISHIADLIKNLLNIHYYMFTDAIKLPTFFPINSHKNINTELIELIECANYILAPLQ